LLARCFCHTAEERKDVLFNQSFVLKQTYHHQTNHCHNTSPAEMDIEILLGLPLDLQIRVYCIQTPALQHGFSTANDKLI
jgi:hypothetical protein